MGRKTTDEPALKAVAQMIFPVRLYMVRDHEKSSATVPYLVAADSPDGFKDGDVVAVYELRETRRLHVKCELK